MSEKPTVRIHISGLMGIGKSTLAAIIAHHLNEYDLDVNVKCPLSDIPIYSEESYENIAIDYMANQILITEETYDGDECFSCPTCNVKWQDHLKQGDKK